MSHGPAVEWKEQKSTAKKAKLGIVMVLIYTVVYGTFVTINVVNPKLMKIDIGSLNLAIVYGFGLIILALVQAVIYNQYCTRLEEKEEAEDAENEANEDNEANTENAAGIKNECSENTATGGDAK
jgi:uncharacterized membrane protein (DUF485 family)